MDCDVIPIGTVGGYQDLPNGGQAWRYVDDGE